jgi:hypothetical protein
VGTDGTYSAFNDTAGTLGTTGVDPGEIILDPDNFKLIDGVDVTNPFLVGTLADNTIAVGLDGQLLIRAEAIVAGTIGADQVSLNKVDGIFANFGTVQGGLIRTAAPNAFRVEIEDQAATFYPLWYGSGAKGDAGGLFYVTHSLLQQTLRLTILSVLQCSIRHFIPEVLIQVGKHRCCRCRQKILLLITS